MKKINLFFFHFSGGNKFSLQSLAENLSEHIQPVFLELPGRGTRFNEPLLTDIYKIIDDIMEQIKDTFHNPYAFYGHSLGTYIAYLLTKKIIANEYPQPRHIFVSGNKGPSVAPKIYHNLPDNIFINELKILGGCPADFFESNELIRLFLPVLRADFKAYEDFKYSVSQKFMIPMTVMNGSDENYPHSDVMKWQDETNLPIDVSYFSGGHFFIFQHKTAIGEIISKALPLDSE